MAEATNGAAPARRRLSAPLLWLAVFLPLFVGYLATSTVEEDRLSPDPVAAALPAWRLANYGDLNLDGMGYNNIWVQEAEGRRVSNRQPGVILTGVPFYAVLSRNPTLVSLFPAAVAASTVTAAAVACLVLAFRRLVETRTAVAAGGLLAVGTSTWSVSADSLWPHGPDQLYLAVGMVFLAREAYVGTGVGYALAVLTRTHLAAAAAVVGIWHSVWRRSPRPAIAVGVPTAMAVAAVAFYVRHITGRWDLKAEIGGSGAARSLREQPGWTFAENIAGFLFSPDRGLLVVSPFLLVLLPGLVAAWRVAPPWVRSSAVGGVVYLLVQARLNYFTGGDRFWGYRLSLETLTLASPLLVLSWREWVSVRAWRRSLFAALAVLAIGYQAVGAILFDSPPYHWSGWTHSWLRDVLVAAPYRGTARGIVICSLVAAPIAAILAARPFGRFKPAPVSADGPG
ncbi:MAG TPA: hypothetical protein VNA12_02830 [Mycobacteriales bacterium]|nr:hypothetical protein [Mycobacteriales bacterium]